jgi:hypothetical protein
MVTIEGWFDRAPATAEDRAIATGQDNGCPKKLALQRWPGFGRN